MRQNNVFFLFSFIVCIMPFASDKRFHYLFFIKQTHHNRHNLLFPVKQVLYDDSYNI